MHKANVLRVSDGLFLECVRAVAARYPDVQYEEQIMDAMAALLVRDASAFDVIVTTNMFGDILSDLAAEISGSLGLAASLNAGTEHAVAQAQHGSAPDIAGPGQRQSGLADRLGGDAARLARRAAQGGAIDARGQRHRGGARPGDRARPNGARATSAARSAPRRSANASRRWWVRTPGSRCRDSANSRG